ncbi:MAG: hypothetical protein R3F55_12850 [Alphaproteobacteria bacterium]
MATPAGVAAFRQRSRTDRSAASGVGADTGARMVRSSVARTGFGMMPAICRSPDWPSSIAIRRTVGWMPLMMKIRAAVPRCDRWRSSSMPSVPGMVRSSTMTSASLRSCASLKAVASV